MSIPKHIETPLLLTVLPTTPGAGSAQSKSHINPLSGGSMNLFTYRISLSKTPSKEGSPPWQTITLSLKTYTKGKAQNS